MQGKCGKDWSVRRAGKDIKDVAFRMDLLCPSTA